MNTFLPYLIYLSVYGLIILGLVVFLRKRGISENIVVFAGFALFGILSGFLAALYGHMEPQYMLNILGVPLSEEIYGYAIDRYGDPSSAFAHYTIPWVLRIPQLAFFTSAIIWGLLGLPAQLIYNLAKKPPPVKKGISMLTMGVSLIALLGVAVGVIYVKQVVTQDVMPTQPEIVRAAEGGKPIPDWETITTYEIESLSLARNVIRIGQEVQVTVMVMNTGSQKGLAVVELKVNGVSNSNEVALLPGESGQVLFAVIFPVEGVYTVSVGHLTQTIEVVAS